MMIDPRESKLVQIVGLISLPKKDHDIVIEYLDHTEYGVALAPICAAILEDELRISKLAFDQIVSVGEDMEMKSGTWRGVDRLADDA